MRPPVREWISGNGIELLENGEEFFPALFAAIDDAEREFLLETYIFAEDEIGVALVERLIAAVGRGVAARVVVDGYGAPKFSEPFLRKVADAGIEFLSFDTQRPIFFGLRTNMFCRMHRKIAVADARVAFIGGINIWDKHFVHFGEESMQDYSVRVTGPIVGRIHDVVRRGPGSETPSPLRRWRSRLRRRRAAPAAGEGSARALLVTRDNRDHPDDIEVMYRDGIRAARHEIWIACAYFFPGYRLMRDIARAARRGVEVRLILQGRPDVAISALAASLLFDHLLAAGVRICQYTERALHAKVAVIDGELATVGSSNLDPISLGLNLEANLFVHDRNFAAVLRERLETLMQSSCVEVTTAATPNRYWRRLLLTILYHATRHIPSWGRLLLRRQQSVRPICGDV
jgi:cardiolipin synthase